MKQPVCITVDEELKERLRAEVEKGQWASLSDLVRTVLRNFVLKREGDIEGIVLNCPL